MRLLGPRERKKSKENFLLAPGRRKRSENFFVFLFRRTNFRSPQKFCVFRQVIEPNKPPLALEIEPLVNEFEAITARWHPIESKMESERERKTTNAFHSFVIRAIERTGRFLMMLSNRILKFKMWPNGRWGIPRSICHDGLKTGICQKSIVIVAAQMRLYSQFGE